MAKTKDLTGWLTTEQVAQELGVKVRTVHNHVYSKNLHPQKIVRPGVEGGAVNLFDPVEVQEYIQKRMDAKTEVLPAGDSTAMVQSRPVVGLMRQMGPVASPSVPITEKVYLTLEEAAELTGWGTTQLKQRCKGIPNGPHGKLIFRRADLVKL